MYDNDTANTYFLNALHLFHETQWLYARPVTELLIRHCLDEFPKEWIEALQALKINELNNFVVKKSMKLHWPNSLKTFIKQCRQIDKLIDTLPNIISLHSLSLPQHFLRGLNPKKQHEIVHLANLVHEQCSLHGINTIVDLGAGLGYICQLLHYVYNYKVLGLESNEANVNTARCRQRKIYANSLDHVKYAVCKVTCESIKEIESALKREFPDTENICLIGLHACGDLSTNAAKIFCNMKAAKLFILVPCCYHKLSLLPSREGISGGKEYFQNFPLSQCLESAIKTSNFDAGDFLQRPFLRLACQESADRWSDMSLSNHNDHSFHVLARAVLELYANKSGCSLKKRVQKATRKSQCSSFESYIDDSLLRYRLEPVGETIELDEVYDQEVLKKRIIELWERNLHYLEIVELYTALQQVLQGPAESLVLQDRLCWLREQNFDAKIVPVMNRKLSPRSHAIVSWKSITTLNNKRYSS